MARLTFPSVTGDPNIRYRFDTEAGTNTPAEIVTLRSAVQITGSVLTSDGAGLLPAFRGPDGIDVLYRKKLSTAGGVLDTVTVQATQSAPAGGGSGIGGDDPRLSDPRAPTPHAATHEAGGTDALELAPEQVTGLVAALAAAVQLVGGKIPSELLPPLAISGEQEPYPVNSQAEMLALAATNGAVAIRADIGKSFILQGDDPTQLAKWLEIVATGVVTSVAGKSGTVALALADVVGLVAALAAKADSSALASKADATLANVTPATGRTSLGLGGAAVLNVGTAAGTVAAGNDSRIVGAAQRSGGNTFLGTQDFTGSTVVGIGGAGAVLLPYTIIAATNAPSAWKSAASATCDGVDDAAEINAAINALTTSTGGLGGTVILSPGTFTCGKTSPTDAGTTASNSDSAVQLRTDVNLVGQGIGVTVLKLRNSFTQGITGILRTFDSSGADIARITVRDLSIDGNLVNQPTGASPRHIGFYIGAAKQGGHWAEDILVERVEVKNCRSYAFDPHERSRRLTFRGCVSHDNGIFGSANTYELCCGITCDWITDSVIEGCQFFRNSDHGIELVTVARRNVVTGNHVWGNGNIGIVLQRGTPDTATLSAAISSTGATSLTVTGTASTLGSPSNGVTGDPDMLVLIDSEQILVRATSGSTMSSLVRGAYGTTAATHSSGATVQRIGWVDGITGLVARSSDFNTISHNRVRGNGAQGIKVGGHRNEVLGNTLDYNCLTTAGMELDVAGTTTAPTFGGSHNHVADNRITTGTVDVALRAGSVNLATYAIGESNAACDYNTFHENHVEGTPTTAATRTQGAHSVLVSAFDISPGGGTDDPVTWSSGAFVDHVAADVATFGTYRDRPLQNISVFPTHNTQAELANAWYLGSAYVPTGYTGDLAIAMPMCSDGNTVSQDCSTQMTSLANTLNAWGTSSNRIFLRLGWEMNLGPTGWPWKVTDANLSTWRARWTTYYNIFKGILGSRVLIGLNGNGGANASGLTGSVSLAWVDGKVDWAGPDQYDCYPPMTNPSNITTQLTRDQGLNWWAALCRTKGVKLALPEWGVSSGTQWAGNCGGDNPTYIETMLDWMKANADIMLFDSYFNEDQSYVESDVWPRNVTNNPNASDKYAELFAQP